MHCTHCHCTPHWHNVAWTLFLYLYTSYSTKLVQTILLTEPHLWRCNTQYGSDFDSNQRKDPKWFTAVIYFKNISTRESIPKVICLKHSQNLLHSMPQITSHISSRTQAQTSPHYTTTVAQLLNNIMNTSIKTNNKNTANIHILHSVL